MEMSHDILIVSLSAIGVLLVLSAFFSGSETALTAASRSLMHELARKGNRRAEVVNRLHERMEYVIGGLLIGNNVVNIAASALATSILITLFGEAGVAYATIVMTVLVVIFSEILPKTFAFQNSNRTALWVAPLVSGVIAVLGPVTFTLRGIVRGILHVVGSKPEVVEGGEELRGAIELHTGDEEADKHARDMLHSILDLADVQVGQIMIHRKNVTMIDADEPPPEVVAQVLASPFTRIPLWRGTPDNIIGVLHAKPLLRAVRARGDDLDGLDVVALASKPWFIPEATTLFDQLQAFRSRREHFALVVDEYGALMGAVTLEDILEEIVGEITDEQDIAVSDVWPQADGSYIIRGDVTIRDLNRDLEWSLPDQEAATVAGLVLHEARRIPEVGQAFMFHGFRFHILRRHRHQITSLRITPPKTLEEGRATEG